MSTYAVEEDLESQQHSTHPKTSGEDQAGTAAAPFLVDSTASNDSKDELDLEAALYDNFSKGRADLVEKHIRLGFIRKVYGILLVQLLITFGIASIFVASESAAKWALGNLWLFWVCFAFSLVSMIGLFFVREKYPANMISLLVFTLFESYMIGVVCSMYTADTVFTALGLTIVVFLGLTAYTFQSKFDWSVIGGALMSTLLVFTVFGFLRLIFPFSPVANMLYAVCGAILFSFYIIFDTYLTLHRYTCDEYILAAVNLYLDFIQLFLYILEIIGKQRDS